jgi:anti-sigma-K factor RskA
MQPWLAAHALGEADDDVAARQHLAACARCLADLREYRGVAGLLPYSAAEAALAPDLRRRLVAAVEREARAAEPAPLPTRQELARPAPRRTLFSRSGWAAFAFAALAVAMLAWNLSLRSQISAQGEEIAFHRQSWQETIGLLNDSSVKWYAVGGGPANGHLWATPNSQDACLVAQGLPPLADDQVLQVWVVRAGQQASAGTFDAHDGAGWALLKADDPVASYDSIFVTVEPRGGSAAPSGPPVMSGSFAAAAAPSLADRQEVLRLLRDGVQGNA